MNKLNLGCGAYKKTGWVNVDLESSFCPEVIHDLNKTPYPFAENEFSESCAFHVLEHLENPFAVMGEIHRITSNDGIVEIRVPHFSRAMNHADHKRGFDINFPLYFNPNFTAGFQGFTFELLDIKLHWLAQGYLKGYTASAATIKFSQIVSKFIDFLANSNPLLCNRLWCFWVGGFDEIQFRFRVVK